MADLEINQLPLSFMSSLFGMNAVELTGNDPSPSSSTSTNSSASSGVIPDEIVSFYPTTFKRQVLVMCKSSQKLNRLLVTTN